MRGGGSQTAVTAGNKCGSSTGDVQEATGATVLALRPLVERSTLLPELCPWKSGKPQPGRGRGAT